MPIVKGSNEKLEEIIYSEPLERAQPPKNGRFNRLLKLFLLTVLLVVGALAASAGLPLGKPAGTAETNKQPQKNWSWFSTFSVFNPLKFLTDDSSQKLRGEERGRVNILLLGIGGKNHDGGLLTDTIMLASLDTIGKKVALISIPRDLSVPIEGMGWRKINSINAYAEKANPGSGGQAVSQAVSHLFNLPVDYYLTVDFTGFAKIIDELGGVKVRVENTLDDYRYPILGEEDNPNFNARWEHLHVDAGEQKMSGELALKFARSRHALGSEGSDFARARRQQLIMEAVKEQLLSLNVLFKPRLIGSIVEAYQEHLSTNLSILEMVRLWNMFKDIKKEDVLNKVIDNGAEGLLTDVIGDDGAYLLVPKSGDFSQIEYLIKNIFASAPPEDLPQVEKVTKEEAAIEVRNGTWRGGLANRWAVDLEKFGFRVLYTGNASQRNFQKTVIYDLTGGNKAESLALLKEKTGANIAYGLPEWLKDDLAKSAAAKKLPREADFVVVLGEEANR